MNRGVHEFSVQAVKNFNAFVAWNYEELDLGTALGGYVTSTYITPTTPAKQVLVYPVPGQTVAANDNLYIYLNDTITNSGSLAAEAMDASETGFDVDDGGDFTAGDVILVDAELMYVVSKSTNTLTVTRGYGTSTAVTHADDTIIWKVGSPTNHTATNSTNPIMKIGVDQLPFKFSGIFMTRLNMWNTGAEGNANDDISILSFH